MGVAAEDYRDFVISICRPTSIRSAVVTMALKVTTVAGVSRLKRPVDPTRVERKTFVDEVVMKSEMTRFSKPPRSARDLVHRGFVIGTDGMIH